jgi:hypothetical protein
MNKFDYFKAAMRSKLFKQKRWVISAFSVTMDESKDIFAYKITQTPTGHFFCDPNNNFELTPIDDVPAGQPAFTWGEIIELNKGDVYNLEEEHIVTTIGNFFFNAAVLSHSFGRKITYINEGVNINKLEALIASLLVDNEEITESTISVSEYLKFVEALFFLTNFTQLAVWAVTEKTIITPPGINEYKQTLIDENKGRLHDPAVIAQIDKKLVAYYSEFLKGDPGEKFIGDGKLKNVVQKKLYAMHGGEIGLSDGVSVDLIENSLSQGWQPEKFPIMNNTQRAGSFSRGAQTMMGGESVKWLLRASSNISVTTEDCGARIGRVMNVEQSNFKKLIGFSVVTKAGHDLVTTEGEAGTYLGKTLMVRSPMYCKLPKTDYCSICVGRNLAANPTALSMAVTEYGSSFMLISMASMHSKALTIAKMDYKVALV